MSDEEISSILKKWFEAKELLSILEARRESYKKTIEKIMNERNTNVVSDKKYIVKRTTQKRTQLNKSDLPADIYSKYSKETEIDFYTIGLMKD